MRKLTYQQKLESIKRRHQREAGYRARALAEDPVGFRKKRAEAVRRYYHKNKKKASEASMRWFRNNRDHANARRREWGKKNVYRLLYLMAKSRAKKSGVVFDLQFEDIPPIGEKCPLLGHPFVITESGRSPFSPSLDRIDPKLGYVKGNVWFVGYRANLIKNDGTAEEHEMIAAAMRAFRV
jgi:hypothetical protein